MGWREYGKARRRRGRYRRGKYKFRRRRRRRRSRLPAGMIASLAAGDCFKIPLDELNHPDEAMWCKNVIELVQKVKINGVPYTVFQKLPFMTLIVRGGRSSYPHYPVEE